MQTGAGVPDAPHVPSVQFKSGHTALISWDEPSSNGAKITEYRLEWQPRCDSDYVAVSCIVVLCL